MSLTMKSIPQIWRYTRWYRTAFGGVGQIPAPNPASEILTRGSRSSVGVRDARFVFPHSEFGL